MAWQRLINAIYVLNITPTNELRDKVEEVLAVDNWLWFLAIENIFADDDSYFNKGADYGFYYEIESGRIHPVEHDGNEAFTAGDVLLSPVQGATAGNRPLLQRLLPIAELRQRYLAHMRMVLQERYNPAAMTAMIDQFEALSINAIIADTIARAKNGKPVLYYTWTPYWVSGALVPGKDVEWLSVPYTSLPDGAKANTEFDGKNLGFAVDSLRIVARNDFLKANPAAAKLFELAKIDIKDISAENKLIADGEKNSADIDKHVDTWIAAHRDAYDGWLKAARETVK